MCWGFTLMSVNRPGHCPANVYLRGAGEYTELNGTKYMVLKPCQIKKNGKWFCEAHQKQFNSDAASIAHTNENAAHVMVWICRRHGPEQPGE